MSAVVTRVDDHAIAAPVAQSEAAAVLSMIERIAKDPTVDMDRVERMMAMHKELRKEEAERGFNAAMSAVQAKLPHVRRDARNTQTNSNYARLETISAAVDPIIADHGISLSFGTDTSPVSDHYRVVCDVRHGAHKERYFADIPIDGTGMKGVKNKTDTHAFGSTMSYARRYLKLMIFDISLTNEDNDGNRPRPQLEPSRHKLSESSATPFDDEPLLTENQIMALRDLIASLGLMESDMVTAMRVKSLSQVRAVSYDRAIALINQKGARHGR